ncbi:hypothetical protein GOBAR_DD08696 [Gossypium barbadense]|nr:hypothetical protein GOBAR_DD08696 [Gossypium barbadense]
MVFDVWNVWQAGASAVLVADDIEEALITMDNPEEDSSSAKYIENITIPSALIEKTFGETLTLMIDFKGASQILEKAGYTQFTPHYITWYFSQAFTLSRQCKSQCINRGRYCAPDPEQGFSSGYEGKDVVIETLRQLFVFKVANDTGRSWRSILLASFPSFHRDIALEVSTKVELNVETNECLENNGGCWQDKTANLTACRDTFRGRVCECLLVDGVQFKGDGYSHCEALAPVGFGYAFCGTTCVANGTFLGDCIQRCLPSEALVETQEKIHLTSSFVFCNVGFAAMI